MRRSRRARVWLRALLLERERIANHLGDLGALGNDAGFAFGLAQFSRLKERCCARSTRRSAQRYLMDVVVPGGVARDLRDDLLSRVSTRVRAIGAEVATLRSIYDEHAGVRDRFVGAGAWRPSSRRGWASPGSPDARAARRSTCASTARARRMRRSSRRRSAATRATWRRASPCASMSCRNPAPRARDPRAAARGPRRTQVRRAAPTARVGVGLDRGLARPVLVALEAGPGGTIRRCHPHDPSWQNWPVLEHAIIGNIVPDFPLINKSFNLSYSGHDL